MSKPSKVLQFISCEILPDLRTDEFGKLESELILKFFVFQSSQPRQKEDTVTIYSNKPDWLKAEQDKILSAKEDSDSLMNYLESIKHTL